MRLAAVVTSLQEALNGRAWQLRFRCNRRKLLHFGRIGEAGKGLMVHPGLFAYARFPDIVRSVVLDDDRRDLAALQACINDLGQHIAGSDRGPSVADFAPLFDAAGQAMITELCVAGVRCKTRFVANDNDTQMLSLRPDRQRHAWRVDVHFRALLQEGVADELVTYVRRRGHGCYPCLDAGIAQAFAATQSQVALASDRAAPAESPTIATADYATVGAGFDYAARLRHIQADYFPDSPPVRFAWARNPGERRLRSIRWGSYTSSPVPTVRLHPRLRRPWVATLFVDHVLHHELCHHIQYLQPRRGEKPHGRRFRELEAGFPQLAEARHWERRFLEAMLAPEAELVSAE